eukprot:TRINITY_DN489_c0_g2_i1.p1 TRINITY_DN489_c0_g2~~TRINITY_DN489_c0_g2_i1.p1  ORF type:complete len:300 (+),score=73.03 TRINITY_DN489_c0_g2_i1:324-1223(+)
MSQPGDLTNANFPMDAEGHVYHVGLKKGELANRLIIVGDKSRAKTVSSFFDSPEKSFVFESARGFYTVTGRYNGVPVTVTSIGMGTSMVDFMVREARAIVDGPMAVIRLGTCGTPKPDVPIGSIAIARDSIMCYQNFDAFYDGKEKTKAADYYHITKPLNTDVVLTQLLTAEVEAALPEKKVVNCTDVTADSFYSSQGRIDPSFADHNETLIDEMIELYPDIGCFQMETYQLCHLARISGTISGAAACIILAQRRSGGFLTHDEKHALERSCGKAVLETIVKWTPEGQVMDNENCVWNK